MNDDSETLVSTDWLARHLDDPDLRILDASWYLPDANRDARAEHAAGHIPGARFVDIDEISDHLSDLPHMVPPPDEFAAAMGALGIGDAEQVVVYDGAGIFSAARIWWLFRLMGKREVAVLDGGLPKWRSEGRALEDRPADMAPATFTPRRQDALLRDVTQVAAAVKLSGPQIVDARSPARFRGDAPEPREGLRAGHIPGSRNLPFGELLREDGTMKDPDALRAAFAAAEVDLEEPIITTCGSGVTAAILALGLARIGHDEWSLYDGSWSEWGSSGDLPVAKGEA